jgi:hypothetical protein
MPAVLFMILAHSIATKRCLGAMVRPQWMHVVSLTWKWQTAVKMSMS